VLLLIPTSHNRDRCHSVIELPYIVGCELDRNGADVLVEALELPAAGDRHNPRLLCQQPGQCDLGWRRAFLRANLGEQVNHNLIRFDGLWRKAWIAAAYIGAVERGALVDLAGEIPPAERAVGHKPNTQLLTSWQHLRFNISPPQRVLALQRRDGL